MKLELVGQRAGIKPPEVRVPHAAGRAQQRLSDLLDGAALQLPLGKSFVRAMHYAPEHIHGPHRLTDVIQVSGQRLGVLSGDGQMAYVDLKEAVFLDTETTGLGAGAGTYVFLVGAGYFDGDRFRVDQFFLDNLTEEGRFLTHLAEFLARFSVLVTFNGKAFDWPLLENRFIRQRLPPLADPLHFDLLHPARRLWKRRLESCALTSLESAILGVRRTEEDVPGWMIPALYFSYLHRGEADGLVRVFYHNLQDILSLASLTIHADRIIFEPHGDLVRHAVDLMSVGRVFEKRGEVDRALQCYEEAIGRGLDGRDRQETLLRMSGILKRQQRWDRAIPVWEQMIDAGDGLAIDGLVELAKYLEHVEGDYLQALDSVQQAILMCELLGDEQTLMPLEHRRGRLLNRVYRERSWVEGRGKRGNRRLERQ